MHLRYVLRCRAPIPEAHACRERDQDSKSKSRNQLARVGNKQTETTRRGNRSKRKLRAYDDTRISVLMFCHSSHWNSNVKSGRLRWHQSCVKSK